MNWKTQILKRIKPTNAEEKETLSCISEFVGSLNKVLLDARAVLGGSGAKGTWLKQHDADLFVLFPYAQYKAKTAELSDILEGRLKELGKKYERLHGSRDYFRFHECDLIYEVIPILEIGRAREALNITDVSPLHAAWVRKNSGEKVRDEIRLAKAFAKAQKCYGAESYIRGFSGYVLEVLVVHYGGFEKLLKNTLLWQQKQIIDAGKLFGKKENVWMVLNEAKLASPLIVIDPVDKTRNAAAALSIDKWNLFKARAAVFLKKPSAAFFDRSEPTLSELQKKKGRNTLLWIEVASLDKKEDVAGAKLLLAFEFLKKRLDEFEIVRSDWEWDTKKCVFWFFLKKKERAKIEIRQGPPISMIEHVRAFKKAHKGAFEKNGFVFAKIAVKHYGLGDYVRTLLNENYMREKVKNVLKVEFR